MKSDIANKIPVSNTNDIINIDINKEMGVLVKSEIANKIPIRNTCIYLI